MHPDAAHGHRRERGGRGEGHGGSMRSGALPRWSDIAVRAVLFAAGVFATIVVLFIIVFLFREGWPFFREVGWRDFLWSDDWNPTAEPARYGARSIILGTFLVTFGSILFAVPFGLATAVFIAEIAGPRLRSVLKPCVELLAGIPSVVYGFFGLVILSGWIREGFDRPTGVSWLASSILLGVMALPTIVSVSEDAISSVPREYREASYGMGATQWQTISRVVLPASLSGITAAVILGIGRAIGETMAVMMVAGSAPVTPAPIYDVFSPIMPITAVIGIEMGEASGLHAGALFALASVLFLIVLAVNGTANAILAYLHAKLTAKRRIGRAALRVPARYRRAVRWAATACLAPLAVYAGYLTLGILHTLFGTSAAVAIVIGCVGGYVGYRRLPPKAAQRAAYALIAVASLAVLAALGVILYFVVANGAQALSWEFLTAPTRDNGRSGGIGYAIVGTLYLVGGAVLVAVPTGIGAGVYLAEYAKENWLTRLVRYGIDSLNATPSIVFGLFGLAFFVFYLGFGISMLTGQLILGFLVLPTIVRTTEEAVKAVPRAYAEGSLALGATKWQTVRKVVLPSAVPGILTGTILAIGRAAGETAPIMFTACIFQSRFLPQSPMHPVQALPFHLFYLITAVPGEAAKRNAYGTALVLIILVLLLYGGAVAIRSHYSRRLRS